MRLLTLPRRRLVRMTRPGPRHWLRSHAGSSPSPTSETRGQIRASFWGSFAQTNTRLRKPAQWLRDIWRWGWITQNGFKISILRYITSSIIPWHIFSPLLSGPDGAGAHTERIHLRVAGEGQGGPAGGVECGPGPGPRQAQHQPRAQGPHRDLRGEQPRLWSGLRDRLFWFGSGAQQIVFVRPNLKPRPGKIQAQERSQNLASAF